MKLLRHFQTDKPGPDNNSSFSCFRNLANPVHISQIAKRQNFFMMNTGHIRNTG